LGGRAGHAQVDVLRGASALESKLEHEPTLERRGLTDGGDDTREEAIEDQELPAPREVGATLGRRLEALFERLLEGLGRGVGAR
jgi:hypothetical protein